jgi:hypothetical protein
MNAAVSQWEIAAPPADIELGFPRKPLTYVAALPPGGIGADTGFMLFICPWGMVPGGDYCSKVLLPRLAERHDCVVAAANYFGILIKYPAKAMLMPPAGLTGAVRRLLGDDIARLPVAGQLAALSRAGVEQLPHDLAFSLSCFPEYQSFGLMPALDNIAVLADVLSRFPVRRDRLYCFGSSYGGYIASLMLKILPNTFHAVIENSGFARARLPEMAGAHFGGHHMVALKGVRVPIQELSPWEFADAASPRFISKAVLDIRDCLIADHYAPSKSFLRSYHSIEDEIVPIGEKRQFWDLLSERMPVRGVEVSADMVDGRLFKTIGHGMEASLLDLAAAALMDLPFSAEDSATDFDRGIERNLAAGDRTYRFRLDPDLGFHARLDKAD